MRAFFPVHRPHAGIGISEAGVALVECRRGWHGPKVVRVSERLLPSGALIPSSSSPNVVDRKVMVQELRELLRATSERTLSLCIPDRSCHVAIFPFETLPVQERDREPILRWRFQHEEHVAVGDARIVHRVFPVRTRTASTLESASNPVGQVAAFVLALAIKRSVVEQYEQICEEVGVFPSSISCASVWLLDLYRRILPWAEEALFIHRAADSMAIIALREGLPVFMRMKAWHGPSAPNALEVEREILSTEQFYRDLYPSGKVGAENLPLPLYMVGEPSVQSGSVGGASLQPDTVEREGLPLRAAGLVRTIQPDWTTMIGPSGTTLQTEAGLWALACAVN